MTATTTPLRTPASERTLVAAEQFAERGQDAAGALGAVHLAGIERADRQQAIGQALFEIAARPQQPRDAAVGFVEAGEQHVEEFGVAVAFGGGDDAGVGDIFRRDHGADDVGVFDGEIGDGGDGAIRRLGARGGDAVAHPARQHAMAAAIGVQRQFQREVLLGAQPRVLAHEAEIAELGAGEQAHHLLDMGLGVLAQFGQDAGIAGFREAADVLHDLAPQRRHCLAGAGVHRRQRLRHDAEFGEPRVRLPQRPEIEGGERHTVNS